MPSIGQINPVTKPFDKFSGNIWFIVIFIQGLFLCLSFYLTHSFIDHIHLIIRKSCVVVLIEKEEKFTYKKRRIQE